MGVLADCYNITFDVKRMAAGAGRIDTETTVASAVPGLFRPVSKSTELFNESNWGKEYQLWTEETVDIQPNDTIEIDSILYGIDNIGFYQDLVDGSEDHFEIRIFKKDTTQN